MIALLNHGETSFTHEVNRYTSEYCIRIIQDGSRETGDYYALAAPQCVDAELNCVAPKNLRAEYDGDKVTLSWEREIFIDLNTTHKAGRSSMPTATVPSLAFTLLEA